MFDKDLFLSLCDKYDVEFSETATSPMIKEGMEVHEITNDDVNRIFAPCQTYFDYSSSTINTSVGLHEFYLKNDYAIAC